MYCWLFFVHFVAEAQLCGVEASCGNELFQDPRGVWDCFLLLFLRAGPEEWLGQGRAGLLWGCWVVCGAGDVWGKLPSPSSIPAALVCFGK